MFDYITKLALFDLLLIIGCNAVCYIHPKGEIDFVCPECDVKITHGCPGPNDCVYPDPSNCKGYIKCIANKYGCVAAVKKSCEDNLEWNDNDKTCDCAQKSTCPVVVPAPTPTPTPSNPYNCVIPGYNTGFNCSDVAACYYQDNSNCSNYYICYTNVNKDNNVVQGSCGAQQWNDLTKSCSSPPSPTCNTTVSCTTTQTTPISYNCVFPNGTSTVCNDPNFCTYQLYPDATCSFYYKCTPVGNGCVSIETCNPQQWDNNSQQCVPAPSPTCTP